jgi:hypothetical protein
MRSVLTDESACDNQPQTADRLLQGTVYECNVRARAMQSVLDSPKDAKLKLLEAAFWCGFPYAGYRYVSMMALPSL